MGAHHSSLAGDIDELKKGVANDAANQKWLEIRVDRKKQRRKVIELSVGQLNCHSEELLLAVKLGESLVGFALQSSEAEQNADTVQQKANVCKMAVALLSWHNSGAWGQGIAFGSWVDAFKRMQLIVDGATVRTNPDNKAKQRQAFRMQFPSRAENKADLQQRMARVISSLRSILKQSSCLVHTPGTCSGSCADATAFGAAAREWVYSALAWEGADAVPLGPPVLQPQLQQADGGADSSATVAQAAGPSRGAKNDESVQDGKASDEQAQDEQAKACIPGPTVAAGSSKAAGSIQLAPLQQHHLKQQMPTRTRRGLASGWKQISEQQAAKAAAEADRAATAAASKLTQQEQLVAAAHRCEDAILRTTAQALMHRKDTRARAVAACRQYIQEAFAALPNSECWKQDLLKSLDDQSKETDKLLELTTASRLRGEGEYNEMIRILRKLSPNPFTAGPSMYGEEVEVLGKGAYGRVVRRINLKTEKPEAIKLVVLNTFPAVGKKMKGFRSKRLGGDLAGMLTMNPRLAAREFILSQFVAAGAEAHVAKPHGCWIEEVTDGGMTAVTMQVPMDEGLDLDKLKLALVGPAVSNNEFLKLPRELRELVLETFALTVGRGVALSLHHAHQKAIYHSDIKMTNAMVMKEGVLQLESLPLNRRLKFLADPPVDVVLIDWGLARAARPIEGGEEKFSVVVHDHGTRYVRPVELACNRDLRNVSKDQVDKLDVWCAGMLIAEASFFEHGSTEDSREARVESEAHSIEERCTLEFSDMLGTSEAVVLGRVDEVKHKLEQCGASGALLNLVKSCLAKAPAERPTAFQLFQQCNAGLSQVLPRLQQAKLLAGPLLLLQTDELSACTDLQSDDISTETEAADSK